jgi:acetylornithine deacetylase
MTKTLTPFELMTKLISFPTVSRDSNLPLIDWVEEYLNSHGITCHRFYDDTEGRIVEKAALFAHVGPEQDGAIVLSGHTDVVPIDGQPWDTDPWTVTEKDGKYYGRGTCDMKGFDALAIWALVEAHKRGVKRPLQIALSFDEEIGCTGAPPMINRMLEVLPKASAVIVGEPSMMQAVTGHKGGRGYMTHVKGFEVHSSLIHTGVNAIMYGAKLIEWANEVNAANMAVEPSEVALQFDPPFTTAHVGIIEGGTAHNITAKDCHFGVDFRVVPGENPLQAVVAETSIALKERFNVPPLVPEENGEAETLVRQITGDNASHKVSYGTEAGQFQERGYSAVICGPGDIAQAHQPNEYCTVAQFNAGHDFMEKLLERLM